MYPRWTRHLSGCESRGNVSVHVFEGQGRGDHTWSERAYLRCKPDRVGDMIMPETTQQFLPGLCGRIKMDNDRDALWIFFAGWWCCLDQGVIAYKA